MTSPYGATVARLLAAAALAAALVGCTDEGGPNSLPSPTTEVASPTPQAQPSPSPSPDDPFAVPDEITADYVERVLNEINRLDAELHREILRSPVDETAQALPADLERRLSDLYADPVLEINRRILIDLLRSPEERDDLKPADEFGQVRDEIEEVLATAPCVLTRVETDYSETDAELDEDTTNVSFVFLIRATEANTTGWKLAATIVSDAAPGSDDEEELRSMTANDLESHTPEGCEA